MLLLCTPEDAIVSAVAFCGENVLPMPIIAARMRDKLI